MIKVYTCLSICLTLLVAACSNNDDWQGVAYPNKSNLLIHSTTGSYTSLEECRAGSMEALKTMNALESGFYECGKDCPNGSSPYNGACQDIVRGNFYRE